MQVDLTWDETNPDRIELTQKLASGKVDDVDQNDLQAYLASSSGEDDEVEVEQSKSESETDDIDPIGKYRSLLNEIETKEKEKGRRDVEMEISWGIDLQKKTDKLIKQKQSESENKTPFQQYLDKRKDKRKEKRDERKKKTMNEENSDNEDSDIPSDIDMNDPYFAEEFDGPEFKQKKSSKVKSQLVEENEEVNKQREAELALLLMNEDDKIHFNMKKIQEEETESKSKRKRKKKPVDEKTDDFEVNVGDERFAALYTSHHFNIDPTDSRYKKTKGMERLVGEKLKRRNEEILEKDSEISSSSKKSKNDAELSVLVKSVKRKAQVFINKKS